MAKKESKSKKTLPKKKAKKKGRPKAKCFVIMPFGSYYDGYYENVYCPAVRKAGFEPIRADDLYIPGTIVDDIWQLTNDCKLVLADLSSKNANVFYELGIAHALKKPVILITDNLLDVPFDLRSRRVIEYDKEDWDWAASLQSSLKKSLAEIKKKPDAAVVHFGKDKQKDDNSSAQPVNVNDARGGGSEYGLPAQWGGEVSDSALDRATHLARDMRLRGWNPGRIFMNLRKRGVPRNMAEVAMARSRYRR